MKGKTHILSFERFCRINDYYRLKKRKAKNKKWIKVIIYPFYITCMVLLISVLTISFFIAMRLIFNQLKPELDMSNYRKVIKRGLLWDTVEYHEK